MLKDNIRLTARQVAGQYTPGSLNIIGDKLVGDRDTPSPGTLCKVLLLALPVPRSRHGPALIGVFYNPLVSAQQMYPIGVRLVPSIFSSLRFGHVCQSVRCALNEEKTP
ncbi:hypothetical protein Sant_3504 [Sodalis praecaptivus]|uniref:Uncharacterized protein n=1 Tax=Sodalis praecaptivus TaxID=1239307 RepID=W0HXC9_9GAMM|nr:hypothetical protein Sant_3504 [Sodalis praecaptivus]